VRTVGDRGKEVVVSTMRRRIAAMVAMVMLLMMMAAPTALAESGSNKGWDGADKNKGGGQEHPKNEHHQGGKFK
jgi:Spy/CpxP family protein refolding chaperone